MKEVPKRPAMPIISSSEESVDSVHMSDRFQEWAHVGEQRELPHEEERHGHHPQGDLRHAKDFEERSPCGLSLPDGIDGSVRNCHTKRKRGERNDRKEGSPPADVLPEKASQGRGNRRRQRVSAVEDGQSPRDLTFPERGASRWRLTSTRSRR